MADYYCQFSTMVKAPVEALDWLEQKLTGQFNKDDDYGESQPCEFERDKTDATELWVGAEDNGEVDRLAEAVCEMQKIFCWEEPWSLTWADTCSKLRVDSWGGGAVICYKGEATWVHTSTSKSETIEKLLKEEGASKPKDEKGSVA